MSHKSLSLKTAAVLAASTLMLAACSSSDGASLQEGAGQDQESSPQQDVEEEGAGQDQESSPQQDVEEEGAGQDQESSPQQKLEEEAGVSIEPGVASCEFNNELEDHQGDGSGVSPYPDLDRAELREEEDAYVVTFTGEFFDPEVLLIDDSLVSLQVALSGEDFTAISPTLMTEFRNGELDGTGTFMDQEFHDQDTDFTLEDGKFTATYAKDSPHFEDFEVDMWTPDVYFDDGDETTNPVSYRCGDGRSWDWEPLS